MYIFIESLTQTGGAIFGQPMIFLDVFMANGDFSNLNITQCLQTVLGHVRYFLSICTVLNLRGKMKIFLNHANSFLSTVTTHGNAFYINLSPSTEILKQ